jgi:hypothetical protein
MENDRSYFERRAGEQQRAAQRARDAEARRRHEELARLLAARASA